MSAAVETDLLREVERFVFLEARLCDELEYDAWEALWTDDGIYWIPANDDDADPTTTMSIVFDNRRRIATRIKQLQTGKRHAAAPPSRLRRVLGNLELLGADGDDVAAAANFVVYESRERGITLWAGRAIYGLRPGPDGLRMASKKVLLVDNDRPVSTISFLL